MTQIYYDQASTGFYCDDLHGDRVSAGGLVPDSAVEIDESLYLQLLSGQGAGQIIVADDSGMPSLADPPGATTEQLEAAAALERDTRLSEAALRIAPLQDALDLGEASADEEALLTEWKRYRVALNHIDQQADYPTSIAWPAAPGQEA